MVITRASNARSQYVVVFFDRLDHVDKEGQELEVRTWITEHVVHYCVANMPGAVPQTSTYALTNATLTYALDIADQGWEGAAAADPALARGVNLVEGRVTYQAVADALGMACEPLEF